MAITVSLFGPFSMQNNAFLPLSPPDQPINTPTTSIYIILLPGDNTGTNYRPMISQYKQRVKEQGRVFQKCIAACMSIRPI